MPTFAALPGVDVPIPNVPALSAMLSPPFKVDVAVVLVAENVLAVKWPANKPASSTANCAPGVVVPTPKLPISQDVLVVDVAVKYAPLTKPSNKPAPLTPNSAPGVLV